MLTLEATSGAVFVASAVATELAYLKLYLVFLDKLSDVTQGYWMSCWACAIITTCIRTFYRQNNSSCRNTFAQWSRYPITQLQRKLRNRFHSGKRSGITPAGLLKTSVATPWVFSQDRGFFYQTLGYEFFPWVFQRPWVFCVFSHFTKK